MYLGTRPDPGVVEAFVLLGTESLLPITYQPSPILSMFPRAQPIVLSALSLKFSDTVVNILLFILVRIYNSPGKLKIYSHHCTVLQDITNALRKMMENTKVLELISTWGGSRRNHGRWEREHRSK